MERSLAKVFGGLFVVSIIAGMVLVNTKANADTSANASVTVSDACTLSGGDHSYSVTLNPGQENSSIGPSNIKAACNDYNGYSIYAIGYSGNSYTGNNTKLLGTIVNNNISTNTSGNDSYWAMKVNAVSGTYTPTITNDFDNSNFHVIPASYTQIAKLTSATDAGSNPTGSNISTYYKVKISTSQTADTYTGKVKYTLVHPNTEPAPTPQIYMQDLTLAQCQANATDAPLTVLDARDKNSYTVRYINGACWMTSNLRFEGNTLDSTSSNVASTTNLTWYDLEGSEATDQDGHCYGESTYNSGVWVYQGAGYSNPCKHSGTDDQGNPTVWYNYAGASAMSIVGVSNLTEASYDICPKNWRLPTNNEQSGIVSYMSIFSPVGGSSYIRGTNSGSQWQGDYWSSTPNPNNSASRRILNYNVNLNAVYSTARECGIYVRCVRTS